MTKNLKTFLLKRVLVHIALIVLLITFFLYIVSQIYTLNMDELKKEYTNRQLLITFQSAKQIKTYFEDLSREFSLIHTIVKMGQMAIKKDADLVLDTASYLGEVEREEIDTYFAADGNGILIWNSENNSKFAIEIPAKILNTLKTNKKLNYFLFRGLKDKNGNISSEKIIFLKPFFDNPKNPEKLTRIAGAVINLKSLFDKFVKPIMADNDMSAWVISSEGIILYLPRHEKMVSNSIFKTDESCFKCHKNFKTENKILTNNQFKGSYFIKRRSMLVSSSTSDNPGLSFKVVTSTPLASVARRARLSYLYMIILSVSVILALIISGGYTIRVNRKRANALREKLRDQEEILYLKEFNENIIRNLPVGIVVIDKERKVQTVNNEIIRMGEKTGLNWSYDMLGKDVAETMPENLRESAISNYNYVLKEGNQYLNPMIVFKGSKGKLLCSVRISPLRDAKNNIVGAIIMREDITEQKRLEAEIKETKDYLEKVFEASVDGIIVTDEKGYIRMANDAVCKMLGYEKEELIGMYTTELSTKESQHIQDQLNILETLRKEGKSAPTEVTYRRKDGTFIPIEQSTAFVYDDKGNLVGAVAGMRDLTEKKKAEERQKELQQRLIHSEKLASIGRLAGGIAHEINNPLSGVITNLGMIKDIVVPDPGEILKECEQANAGAECTKKMAEFYEKYLKLEKKRQRLLETAYKGGDRCKKIIQDLLVFARPSAKREEEEINLNTCIEESLEIIHNQLILNNITVNKKLSEGLKPIKGVKKELDQIFLNFFVNAFHAMKPDGGELSIESFNDNSNVVVKVSDTGCGMTPEVMNKIFDPFFTTKDVGSGTGLGLSIVYEIIQNHNGTIDVKSKVNEGTTFTLKFPVAQK
ncbi:MAG: PAS domain S-box protein [Candidatus Schekmanbacteria bacterium]|nr:MAG: PAS domain S-box protein [Candidatus Schekmanbacteria bacterium]